MRSFLNLIGGSGPPPYEDYYVGKYPCECKFRSANLQEAWFEGTNLGHADFTHADLTEAHFEEADLSLTVGVTQSQLNSSFGNYLTVLGNGLTRPAHWSAATPDKQSDSPDNTPVIGWSQAKEPAIVVAVGLKYRPGCQVR